eukprot:523287_1
MNSKSPWPSIQVLCAKTLMQYCNFVQDVIDMAALPTDMKGWRACMSCALIKTFSQFADRGCDNCPFLSVEEGLERVHECTSQHFSGVIALIEPQTSWVARWQGYTMYKPGMYAVDVIGELHIQDKETMTEAGIMWKCRPVSEVRQ